MIRIFNKQLVAVENGAAKNVATVYCNSSDTKPTSDLANGSKLTEVDTGKNYLFNEATSSWVEVSGGGGSGGSDNNKVILTGTMNSLDEDIVNAIVAKYPGDGYGWQTFCGDFTNGNVSGIIRFTMGDALYYAPLNVYYSSQTNTGTIFIAGNYNLSQAFSIHAGITNGYRSTSVYALQGGTVTDLTDTVSSLPYTLALCWHEMPH